MLLVREVHGWLRHLLNSDAVTKANAIIVEELPAYSLGPLVGDRVLGVRKFSDGMTPRLEVIFTNLHPQVFWVPPGSGEKVLLAQTNQFGFPGDYKSWTVSDLCSYLMIQAKAKLCLDSKALLISIGDEDEKDMASISASSAVMPIDNVIKTLDLIHHYHDSKKKINGNSVNDFLKKKGWGDVHKFALAVLHYFREGTMGEGSAGKKRKVEWSDIDLLENRIDPGFDIVPFDVIKRNLDFQDPKIRNRVPPKAMEQFLSASSECKPDGAYACRRAEELLQAYVQGKPMRLNPLQSRPALGRDFIAGFTSGEIPTDYLQQLSAADPAEQIMPWSMLQRSIFAYSYPTGIKADANEDLPRLVVEWLDKSHLLLPLYDGEETEREALKSAISQQLKNNIGNTIGNEPWLRSTMDSFVGQSGNDLKKSLQVEFDMWLMNALRPAVEQWKLPLSPYAFSRDYQDQEQYNLMLGVWVQQLKDYQARQESKPRLEETFSDFYKYLRQIWEPEKLEDFTPKTPPAAQVLDVARAGDAKAFLALLTDDFSCELGKQLPERLEEQLLRHPTLIAPMREIRLQTIQLP